MLSTYGDATAELQARLGALRNQVVAFDVSDDDTDSDADTDTDASTGEPEPVLELLRRAITDAERDGTIVAVEPLFYPLFHETGTAALAAVMAARGGLDEVEDRLYRLFAAAAWPVSGNETLLAGNLARPEVAGMLVDVAVFARSRLRAFCDDYVASACCPAGDSDAEMM